MSSDHALPSQTRPETASETAPEILCIGSVLWDIIGRAPAHMRAGSDVPGRIISLPGGVAMNIAMTLARFGMRPAVLTAIGRDSQGEDLIKAARGLGVECDYAYRSEDLPTDRYMAIEGANGLIAAVADAHSLEAAGEKILRPLFDGTLGSEAAPWRGPIALDGNLTTGLLGEIARAPEFAQADLRVAPASPGKAERLEPFGARVCDTPAQAVAQADFVITLLENGDVVEDVLFRQGVATALRPGTLVVDMMYGPKAQPFADWARERGWACALPHFRGCSGEINDAPRAYHSGDHEEIGWMLDQLQAAHPGPLVAVGVSLGGNALMRWAAEAQGLAARSVRAVAAVCAPLPAAFHAGGAPRPRPSSPRSATGCGRWARTVLSGSIS